MGQVSVRMSAAGNSKTFGVCAISVDAVPDHGECGEPHPTRITASLSYRDVMKAAVGAAYVSALIPTICKTKCHDLMWTPG